MFWLRRCSRCKSGLNSWLTEPLGDRGRHFLDTINSHATRIKQIDSDSLEMPDLASILAEDRAGEFAEIERQSLQLRLSILDEMCGKGLWDEDAVGARIEVRAGVGGDEAGKWANELFDMYINMCCVEMGWDFEPVLGTGKGGVPGSEKVFQAIVPNANAYGWLKYESGVHRVQRIPFNSDRMQTSAAAVYVMPKVTVPITQIRDSDLKVYISKKSSGAGGQSVNAAYQQVRMVHLPSGFSVVVNESHAQQENREIALAKVTAHVQKIAEEKVVAALTHSRKSQIHTGDRSEKVRTYNYERGEINDHRVGITVKHDCEEFLKNGDLHAFWTPLKWQHENARINEYLRNTRAERV